MSLQLNYNHEAYLDFRASPAMCELLLELVYYAPLASLPWWGADPSRWDWLHLICEAIDSTYKNRHNPGIDVWAQAEWLVNSGYLDYNFNLTSKAYLYLKLKEL